MALQHLNAPDGSHNYIVSSLIPTYKFPEKAEENPIYSGDDSSISKGDNTSPGSNLEGCKLHLMEPSLDSSNYYNSDYPPAQASFNYATPQQIYGTSIYPPPQTSFNYAAPQQTYGTSIYPPPQTSFNYGPSLLQNPLSYTGRCMALLIGTSYFGQRGQLRGCNDAKNMLTLLNEGYGCKRENMIILTEDMKRPTSLPTKQNILLAMHWLVKDAQPNDELYFYYSGHSGQTGDETDGYDQAIYPVDFRKVGHIVGSEIHRIMVSSLPPGVRLTAVIDSYHTNTIYPTTALFKAQEWFAGC